MILRIVILVDSSSLHANIVIYDKLLNKLVRFEPYGDWEFADSYNLDQLLINMFKNALDDKRGKLLKYIRPQDYLNKAKFQTASQGDHTNEKNLGDPAGYCLAWCFWFLELKSAHWKIVFDNRYLMTLKLSQFPFWKEPDNDPK